MCPWGKCPGGTCPGGGGGGGLCPVTMQVFCRLSVERHYFLGPPKSTNRNVDYGQNALFVCKII